MKSVGEAMAIGRTFQESLQKALRSLETGLHGLDEIEIEGLGQGDDKNAIRAALGTPTPDRLLKVAQAMRLGFDVEQIYEACKIDKWFLEQIAHDRRDREPRAQPRPADDAGRVPATEVHGLFGRPPRHAREAPRGGGHQAPPGARRAARLQAHRHLRGGVRLADRLHVLDLRAAFRRQAGGRGASLGPQEDRHPRRRAEPHRPGHRVRLLLLPRLLRAR